MGNPLYNPQQNNPYTNMIGQIMQFGQTIKGDPKQMVEQLLASGQMSQQELNKYSQMAQQIMPFMKQALIKSARLDLAYKI